MSESSRGVIARVRFNHPPSGRGQEPNRVEHLQLGITWRVTEILDRWERPGRAEDMLGKPDLIKWWLLKVSGPLPGRPAELGEFVMEVSAYGSPPGWWITVEHLQAAAGRGTPDRLDVIAGASHLGKCLLTWPGDAHWCASLTYVEHSCPARIRPIRGLARVVFFSGV